MPDSSGGQRVIVGLLADPDTPTKVAEKIRNDLPTLLKRRVDPNVSWEVRVSTESLITTTAKTDEVFDAAYQRAQRDGWDFVIVLTDLPLRTGWRPLVADLRADCGVAGLSLPTLGGFRLRQRTREAIVGLVAELANGRQRAGLHGTGFTGRITKLIHPIQRIEPDNPDLDARFVTSVVRGRVRLLAGMVRDNEPWRLVLGLSSALAAALATSAFMLLSSTVWQLTDALGPLRLLVAMLGSIGLMTAWIVLDHHLWERARSRADREEAVLYNVTTLVTIGIGVTCMYAAVFLLALAGSAFFLSTRVLSATVGHPVGAVDYLRLAWLATSAATVAGALGSGLESEETVRHAAYGYRERQRKAQREREAAAEQAGQARAEKVSTDAATDDKDPEDTKDEDVTGAA